MKNHHLIPLIFALLGAPALRAAVPINPVPTPDPFVSVPSVTDWSTLSVGTPLASNVNDFDTKIIGATDAAAITTTLGSSGTYPPSTNAIARQNTGANTAGTTFLQTRPTGIEYILLMATLVNNTGGALNSVRLAYEFSSANNSVEDVEGLRAYFSMTGAPGSWTLIPDLSVDTAATYDLPDLLATTVVLPGPLADAGNMYILWADQNSTGVGSVDASHHIRNFAASPGIDCVVDAPTINPVRMPGVDPADPADDIVTFSTTITATGADAGPGWIIASGPSNGTTGNYGDTQNFNVPIADFTGGPIVLRIEDQTTPFCFFQTTIVAPPFAHSVTALNSPLITFDYSNVGDGSYAAPLLALTEPGWAGGTNGAATNSNVQTQPAPSTETLKYFHMTTNAALTTDPVDVGALKGAILKGELQLAFYSTSNTGLDDADLLNFRIEVAQDGNFSNTTGGNLITTNIRDVLLGAAPAFGDSIAASTPHIGLNTVGFPTADFTFHTLSASVPIPSGASAPRARIIAQGIVGIGTSEHVLVDNIRFSSNTSPTLDAKIAGPSIWSNNGTVTATDDGFFVPVNIFAFNVGASTGWASDESPVRNGLYSTPNPVSYGPFPSRTAASAQLTDNINPAAMSPVLTFTPPVATLTATLVGGTIARQENGPGDADDTVTFQINVAATNLGPAFTAAIPLAPTSTTVTGAGNYPPVATPVTLTITNVPNSAANLNVVIADASYPTAPGPITIAVAIPAPTAAGPVIVGQKNFGPGLTDVLATGIPAPEWHNFPASRELRMNAGIATDSVVESEVLDLSSVGAVNFSAQLIANDVSTGTNFEQADRFKAELIIDGGLDIINLVTAFDIGDGAGATTVGANGAPNGFINGYSGAAGTDLETNVIYVTGQEDLDAHLDRDEFNTGLQTVDNVINNTLSLSAIVPANASTVQLRITGAAVGGTESIIVANVLFTGTVTIGTGDSDGDGISDADEAIMGTDPNNAADVLRLSQPTGNPKQVTFPSKAGRFYRVYVSDGTAPATHLAVWKDSGLATLVGNGGNLMFSLAVVPGEPRRFFRLHVKLTDGPWPATLP